MRRRVVAVGGVVAVVLALLVWRSHSDSSRPAGDARPNGGPALAGFGGQRGRIDPRTLQRASIAGTITDEDHAPIPHARVCADVSSDGLSSELVRDPRCTNADDHGHYALDNLFAASYRIAAMAKPFQPAVYHPDGDRKRDELELHAGEHATGIDLALRKGGVEITGTVADITGGPIAHAQVRARAGWDGGLSPTLESDDAGRFSLWVRPGQVIVTAVADGYTEGWDNGIAPGKFELLLTPESSLAGTVVDARTKLPVPGVTVEVTGGGWNGDGDDLTDDNGHFRVTRLAPGRYSAAAHAPHGYGHSDGSTLVGLGQHVGGVVVKLYPAARVDGKVVIDGKPPVTCKLSTMSLQQKGGDRSVSATRDPDGTLHADGVLPGTYEVEVSCPGHLAHDNYPPIEVKDQDIVGLEWGVDVGATIRGRVVTRSGEPVEDATVSAKTVGGARTKGGRGDDSSQRDGAYKLDGLKAGAYRIQVRTDKGIGPRDGWKLDVAAGAVVEQDLVVDEAGTIMGTVVDADAKPIGGVRVAASALTGRWSSGGGGRARSSDDGSFTLTNIRPGDYRVTASRGASSEELRKPGSNDDAKRGERVTVHAAQTATVHLVVESVAGTIKGTVTDSLGKPVPDAFVAAARESDAAGAQQSSVVQTRWSAEDKPVVTDTDGTFTVGELSPGSYTLRAFRQGGEAIAEHVPIGGTAKLQIKATGSIEGTARRAGSPPDELDVTLRDDKTGFGRDEHYFRTAGSYAVHDLPAGRLTVTFHAEGGEKQTTVELAEGEHKTEVDVEPDALVTLTGRIVELVSHQPVPGIAMMASSGGRFGLSSGDDRENTSDAAGRFVIKNAPRGQVTLFGYPTDFRDSEFGFIQAVRSVDGTGTVDLGDITVTKRRVKLGDPVGELGVHWDQAPPDTPIDGRRYKVSWIDPAGPAAKTDLKVGDVVTTIDGIDVTGASSSNARNLMNAPPGAQLVFGLARGTYVTIVLAAP